MKFNELIAEYTTRSENQKVRRNSFDDYGLGPQFIFIGGTHLEDAQGKPRWHVVYARLTPAALALLNPQMFAGRVESLEFHRYPHEVTVHVFANSPHFYNRVDVGVVEDLPGDLGALILR